MPEANFESAENTDLGALGGGRGAGCSAIVGLFEVEDVECFLGAWLLSMLGALELSRWGALLEESEPVVEAIELLFPRDSSVESRLLYVERESALHMDGLPVLVRGDWKGTPSCATLVEPTCWSFLETAWRMDCFTSLASSMGDWLVGLLTAVVVVQSVRVRLGDRPDRRHSPVHSAPQVQGSVISPSIISSRASFPAGKPHRRLSAVVDCS
jgi:hypothetical protein